MRRINVTQKEGEEIPTEILAKDIQAISDGIKRIKSGRLNDKAMVLLISHASGVAQRDVKAVIEGMESLASTFLKRKA